MEKTATKVEKKNYLVKNQEISNSFLTKNFPERRPAQAHFEPGGKWILGKSDAIGRGVTSEGYILIQF
jgi:hypothetical protein